MCQRPPKMTFAECHVFLLNDQYRHATKAATVTNSSTIPISMLASRQTTHSITANSAHKHNRRSIYLPVMPSTRLSFSAGLSRPFQALHHLHRYWRPPAFWCKGLCTFESLSQPDSVTFFYSSYTGFPVESLSSTCSARTGTHRPA